MHLRPLRLALQILNLLSIAKLQVLMENVSLQCTLSQTHTVFLFNHQQNGKILISYLSSGGNNLGRLFYYKLIEKCTSFKNSLEGWNAAFLIISWMWIILLNWFEMWRLCGHATDAMLFKNPLSQRHKPVSCFSTHFPKYFMWSVSGFYAADIVPAWEACLPLGGTTWRETWGWCGHVMAIRQTRKELSEHFGCVYYCKVFTL